MDDLHPTQRRMHRLAAMSLEGDAVAAELELHEWRRQPDFPAPARIMLAALLARQGDLAAAREALGDLLLAHTATTDPRLTRMLIALLVMQGLDDAAERLAAELARLHPDDAAANAWLSLMSLIPADNPASPDNVRETEAAQLAARLRVQPELIPSLVHAQKLEPHAARIALLREALAKVEGEFALEPEHATLCLALAELAELADCPHDARRWAQRGLAVDPYSAALAMVLDRVGGGEIARLAAQTLDRAAAHHPDYPDLKAALIRREFANGDIPSATKRLAQWLEQDPQSHLAQQVQQELAA